jgi:hypothetical protein
VKRGGGKEPRQKLNASEGEIPVKDEARNVETPVGGHPQTDVEVQDREGVPEMYTEGKGEIDMEGGDSELECRGRDSTRERGESW